MAGRGHWVSSRHPEVGCCRSCSPALDLQPCPFLKWRGASWRNCWLNYKLHVAAHPESKVLATVILPSLWQCRDLLRVNPGVGAGSVSQSEPRIWATDDNVAQTLDTMDWRPNYSSTPYVHKYLFNYSTLTVWKTTWWSTKSIRLTFADFRRLSPPSLS